MTNQETIDVLDSLKHQTNWDCEREALNIAIKALEVDIVYCGECEKGIDESVAGDLYCTEHDRLGRCEDYCSYGIRKE